ncbi:hypothetical protein [Bryobacter aggregatus]|uniref:hypothetical protein n=1 Tax=Bryobacter aggregatus TaxID=360054 RepID=UPI0004E24568|nr:hypothetical protein [Bryobacter aggregatus]
MSATSHSSNAYTDREKMFLIGPITVLTTAVLVFLYVYSTIPSKPYPLQEHGHGAAATEAHAAPAGHSAEHP